MSTRPQDTHDGADAHREAQELLYLSLYDNSRERKKGCQQTSCAKREWSLISRFSEVTLYLKVLLGKQAF